jgi:AraC-like DNA-binding protein
MPGSGAQTFFDPDDYQAGLRQSQIDLVVTCSGAFQARETWVELDRIYLLRCQEEHSRIAYLSLPPALAFVAYRTDPGPPPLWAGMELQSKDLVFHGPGARLHQRTMGPCIWNLIALTSTDLDEFGRTLFEQEFAPPIAGGILRPSGRDLGCLQRLHAAACRLAETRPQTLTHREVARSLQQDLILALVTCLTTAAVRDETAAQKLHARIMIRFEEVLLAHLHRALRLRELCELIGVSDRTLQSCCTEFLGISPSRYVLLRRLKAVRIALRDADATTASVTEIANEYGFARFGGRFDAAYLAAFGEPPSVTLRRAPGSRFLPPIFANSR